MATYSTILAWRIPWTEEPGGLQPIRSQRFWHDWSNLTHMPRYRNTWFCPSLYCALQILRAFFFFFRLNVSGNTYFKQVHQHHFSNSVCSLHLSLSHFDNSPNISSFSIIIIFAMVICNPWPLILTVIVLRSHDPCHPYKTVNLPSKCGVSSDYSTDWPFLHLSTSPWASLLPEIEQY